MYKKLDSDIDSTKLRVFISVSDTRFADRTLTVKLVDCFGAMGMGARDDRPILSRNAIGQFFRLQN